MYGLTKRSDNRLAPLARFDRGASLWDRLFDELAMERAEYAPRVRLSEDENNYYIRAELPGISNDEVDLEYRDGVLKLSVEHEEKNEKKEGERVIFNEQSAWSFQRLFHLPHGDSDKAEADLKDGMLTVTMPKSEETKPRQIKLS